MKKGNPRVDSFGSGIIFWDMKNTVQAILSALLIIFFLQIHCLSWPMSRKKQPHWNGGGHG
jgi:hypothetical protein